MMKQIDLLPKVNSCVDICKLQDTLKPIEQESDGMTKFKIYELLS